MILAKDKLCLAIDKTDRGDCGTFNVKLTNDAGEVECPITIKVVGRSIYLRVAIYVVANCH